MKSLKNRLIMGCFLISISFIPLLSFCGGKSSDTASNASNFSLNESIYYIKTKLTQKSLSLSLLGNLQLAAPASVVPTSYVVNLSGCASGLTGNNGTTGQLNVHLKDTGCLGKLTSFVINGTTYQPIGSNAVPFTTWAVGNTATFQGSSASDLIYVQVISQLSSPIQLTDTVSYEFYYNNLGTNNNGSAAVSNSDTISIGGQDAPNFSLSSGNITFNGVDINGSGIFTFTLTCVNGPMLTGANPSYKTICPTLSGGTTGVDVGVNFSYKLIAGSVGGTITLAQAIAAFNAGGDSNVTLSSTYLPAGNNTFVTLPLTGPGVISSNQYMILILQSKNSANPSNPSLSSFQYFAINLPTTN